MDKVELTEREIEIIEEGTARLCELIQSTVLTLDEVVASFTSFAQNPEVHEALGALIAEYETVLAIRDIGKEGIRHVSVARRILWFICRR